MNDTFMKKFDRILRSDSQRSALAGMIVGLIKLDPETSFESVQYSVIETLISIMEEIPVDDTIDDAFNEAIIGKSGVMGEVFSIINDN